MDFLFRYYDYLLFIIIGLVEHCELLLDRVECVFANVINATLTIYIYIYIGKRITICWYLAEGFDLDNGQEPTDRIKCYLECSMPQQNMKNCVSFITT